MGNLTCHLSVFVDRTGKPVFLSNETVFHSPLGADLLLKIFYKSYQDNYLSRHIYRSLQTSISVTYKITDDKDEDELFMWYGLRTKGV